MRAGASSILLSLALLVGGLGLSCHHVQTATPATKEAAAPALNYEEANGQMLFEHYCAVCHGKSGAGDGFNAYNLKPAQPGDFTDAKVMAKLSDQDLFTSISKGGRAMGGSPLMPDWGHTLNDRQIHYLIRYLRTLPATHSQ